MSSLTLAAGLTIGIALALFAYLIDGRQWSQ